MTDNLQSRRAVGGSGSFILTLGIWLVTAFAFGSSPNRPTIAAGFGATARQCEVAYGSPKVVTGDLTLIYPRTRSYVTGGWLMMVGFSEQDQAEQFVFSKSAPPPAKPPALTAAEQEALLDQFKGGSTWNAPHDTGNGPIWMRADGQAHASYIADQHWLVMMNAAGMARSIKALPQNSGRP